MAALFLSVFSKISSSQHQMHSFLDCLNSGSLPSKFIFTPENQSYTSLFFSSIQNNRTLLNSPKPLLIITPTLESHVSATVLCSKELNIPLRTRSGGHDYEGLSYTTTSSSFVLIDLHKFRSITIDLTDNTAWADAGATLGELYYSISSQSGNTLAFPAGVCPTVGLGGHFSGGGLGMMMRAYGLAVDNIIDARIATASGEVLDRGSMGEDLFWALRGGGGASFGIILSYKLKLLQIPPKVTVLNIDKLLEQGAIKLLAKWQQIAHNLDKRLFLRVVLQVVDDENHKSSNKTLMASFQSLFLGEQTELLTLMAESFPELGVKSNHCVELSWIRSVLYIAGFPPGGSLKKLLDRKPQYHDLFKTKSDFLSVPFNVDVWEAISARLVGQNEPPYVIIDPFGGRMDEIGVTETPFPHRKGSLYGIQYIKTWEDPGVETARENIDRMRNLYKFMTPYVSRDPRAAYLNYRDLDLGRNANMNASYSEASVWGEKYYKVNFRRLAQVKSKAENIDRYANKLCLALQGLLNLLAQLHSLTCSLGTASAGSDVGVWNFRNRGLSHLRAGRTGGALAPCGRSSLDAKHLALVLRGIYFSRCGAPHSHAAGHLAPALLGISLPHTGHLAAGHLALALQGTSLPRYRASRSRAAGHLALALRGISLPHCRASQQNGPRVLLRPEQTKVLRHLQQNRP
ncbi:hypothetical protein KSP39_PZI011076 [Platanthera zijinensis]|uniref:FAD-binding PCMH-type domain-containing protein n=1 Tax=Platanthera zijinensis TaxID=2320716 RepID=A0AAP0BG22_9ASPA